MGGAIEQGEPPSFHQSIGGYKKADVMQQVDRKIVFAGCLKTRGKGNSLPSLELKRERHRSNRLPHRARCRPGQTPGWLWMLSGTNYAQSLQELLTCQPAYGFLTVAAGTNAPIHPIAKGNHVMTEQNRRPTPGLAEELSGR